MQTDLVAFLLVACASTPLAQSGSPCSAGPVFDDGSAESFVGPFLGPCDLDPRYSFALTQCTPPSYPFHYDQVCAFLAGPGAIAFDAVVFDDDGAGGGPGTLLTFTPATASVSPSGTWVQAPLDCRDVTNGSRWIGVRAHQPCSGMLTIFGVDTSGSHAFVFGTGSLPSPTWMPISSGAALMLRAAGAPGSVTAEATVRNGSGVNPLSYGASPPVIGSSWSAVVLHSPAATFTVIQFRLGASEGLILPAGEVLLDLRTPRLFVSTRASSGVQDPHGFAIPDDPSLVGVSLTSQAGILTATSFSFCNAVDLRIGCQ